MHRLNNKMIFLKVIVLFLISKKACDELPAVSRFMNSYYDVLDSSSVIKNINDFNNISRILKSLDLYYMVYLVPNHPSFLSNPIVITDRLYTIQAIAFNKIIGFDVSKPFLDYSYFYEMNLVLQFSLINFLKNNQVINRKCDDLSIYNNVKLFNKIGVLTFYTGSVFDEYYCPFIFNNSNIDGLFTLHLSNTFIRKNYLSFMNANMSIYKFESNVSYLFINGYYLNADERTLHKNIYKETETLKYTGIIGGLKSGVFYDLKSLKKLYLELDDLRSFLHKSTEWIKYLNGDIYVKDDQDSLTSFLKEKKYDIFILGINIKQEYTFPYEDFCLFKNYPHTKLVLTSLFNFESNQKDRKCSCTVQWLYKNKHIYENYIDYVNNKSLDNFELSSYTNRHVNKIYYPCSNQMDKCYFESTAQKCNRSLLKPKKYYKTLTEYDTSYENSIIFFISQIILMPLFSIIGFISNLFSFLSIRRASDLRKDTIYKLSKVNNIINAFYCAISLLKLVDTCIKDGSIYCPYYRMNTIVQYFDIFITKYLFSSLRICSYLIETIIAYNCLFLLIRESRFKFNKPIRASLTLIVGFSFGINFVIIRQYNVNQYYQSEEFPFDFYSFFNCMDTYSSSCWIKKYSFIIFYDILTGPILIGLLVIHLFIFLYKAYQFNKENTENKRIIRTKAKIEKKRNLI